MVVGVLVLCLSGCHPDTKQKMLNFFFTGVPTPEEIARQKKEAEERRQKKEAQQKPSVTEVAKISEKPSKEKEVSLEAKKVYSHAPYAEGQCNGCHMGSMNFRSFRSGGSTQTFSKGGGKPGVLIAPRKKLCIKCHEYLSPDKASSSGLWLHTTAAKGDCDACHAPHQSEYPGVLLDKPEEICRECHPSEKIMNIPDHSKPGECLDCHNPHLGKNRMLLKKDFQEEQHRVKQTPNSPDSRSLSDTKEKGINPESKTEILKSSDPIGSDK